MTRGGTGHGLASRGLEDQLIINSIFKILGSNRLNQIRQSHLLFLFIFWLLTITVFRFAFIGMIRDMLINPIADKPIDTLDDLIEAIEHKGYWWGFPGRCNFLYR